MKTIISTSQRASTVRHEFIKISLYSDSQYTPVLVVKANPQIQHIVQRATRLKYISLLLMVTF